MAAKYIKCFRLRFIRVTLSHAGRGSLLLVVDDLATALIKVHIEEDHLLNVWHIKDSLQVEVHWGVPTSIENQNERCKTMIDRTYSFLKSLSVYFGKFAMLID